MTPPTKVRCCLGLVLAGAGLATGSARAQDGAAAARPLSDDPNPYFAGVSEGLTHDSNVYRISGGPGDSYSSTSLFGGFDQPIGRQRVFGNGSVSVNRYFDQTTLNNTSYNLAGGVSGSTVMRLSGGLDATLNQNLAAPPASTAPAGAQRNVARTGAINAHAQWGGDALLTLQAAGGHARVEYSAPAYASSNASSDYASLALYYRPGGRLRVGLGVDGERTRSPMGLQDPVTGAFSANRVDDRSIDLLANYAYSGLLDIDARLSYTHQTNANNAATGADFSGLTGRLAIDYRATGRITLNLAASRDAGLDTALFSGYSINVHPTVGGASPTSASAPTQKSTTSTGTGDNAPGPIVAPVSGLYENNRLSDSIVLSANYAASNKINAYVGARYIHAQLMPTLLGTSGTRTTDVTRGAFLGATYAISRAWSAACSVSHESRRTSGALGFSYSDNAVGCSASLTWR